MPPGPSIFRSSYAWVSISAWLPTLKWPCAAFWQGEKSFKYLNQQAFWLGEWKTVCLFPEGRLSSQYQLWRAEFIACVESFLMEGWINILFSSWPLARGERITWPLSLVPAHITRRLLQTISNTAARPNHQDGVQSVQPNSIFQVNSNSPF